MKKSPSKSQKKTQVSQLEEDFKAGSGLTTQVYREGQRKDWKKETLTPEIIDQRDDSENDPKDLDKKVPWPVLFSDKELHQKV